MAECTCADPTAVAQAIRDASRDQIDSREDTIATEGPIDQTLYGSKLTGPTGGSGSHGAMGPIRNCRWAASEVTGAGNTWYALALQAATMAIQALTAAAQSEIQDMQMDLADGYYQQAKYKWNRFNSVYRPLEQKLLDEVSNTPVRSLDCAGAKSRARTSVASAYSAASGWMTREARKMRLCVDSSTISLMNYRRSVIDVDTENYNLVDDQWYTDYKNDQRWNRRSNVLNLGRNLSSEVLNYGNVANALLNTVSGQLDKAANAVVTALGYFGARNDTAMPNTYLGGTQSGLVQLGPTSVAQNVQNMSGIVTQIGQSL
jgi:hypothetical protein